MWIRHTPLCHRLLHLNAYFPELENSFPREDQKPAYVNMLLFLTVNDRSGDSMTAVATAVTQH